MIDRPVLRRLGRRVQHLVLTAIVIAFMLKTMHD
jgi:hypothetical protein